MSKCRQCESPTQWSNKKAAYKLYCSKKCGTKWRDQQRYTRKNPHWGAVATGKRERKVRLKWCKEHLFTARDVADEYNLVSTNVVFMRATLLEIKGERPNTRSLMFFTKEQARLIGTAVVSAIQTETAKKWREKKVPRTKEKQQKYNANRRISLLKDPIRHNREKTRQAAYQKMRRSKDPTQRLRGSVSHAVWKTLKRQHAKKHWSTFPNIGYTPQQLAEYIETQFDDKMTWDNYGAYWQLDHVVPQCVLQYDSMEHPNFKKCWALENLQPLARVENASKGSFYEGKRWLWK